MTSNLFRDKLNDYMGHFLDDDIEVVSSSGGRSSSPSKSPKVTSNSSGSRSSSPSRSSKVTSTPPENLKNKNKVFQMITDNVMNDDYGAKITPEKIKEIIEASLAAAKKCEKV